MTICLQWLIDCFDLIIRHLCIHIVVSLVAAGVVRWDLGVMKFPGLKERSHLFPTHPYLSLGMIDCSIGRVLGAEGHDSMGLVYVIAPVLRVRGYANAKTDNANANNIINIIQFISPLKYAPKQ